MNSALARIVRSMRVSRWICMRFRYLVTAVTMIVVVVMVVLAAGTRCCWYACVLFELL